jgi:hypothetical protein
MESERENFSLEALTKLSIANKRVCRKVLF